MCTAISIPYGRNSNASYLVGRTMDFEELAGGTAHRTSRGKYKVTQVRGVSPMINLYLEGINTDGLSASAIWLPESKFDAGGNVENTIKVGKCIFEILENGSSATVDDFEARLKDYNLPILDIVISHLTICFAVHDKTGNSAVFELENGKWVRYNNHTGVCTNSPKFNWHLENIRNYLEISAENTATKRILGRDYTMCGFGNSLAGISSDVTSTSRFIQAVITKDLVVKDAIPATLDEAWEILNTLLDKVSVIKGTVKVPNSPSPDIIEYTRWKVIKDIASGSMWNKEYTSRKYVPV